MNFEMCGDFDFYQDRAVLHVVIPMKMLRHLVGGGDSRYMTVTNPEVISILVQIYKNQQTTDEYRSEVKTLLELALRSPNSSTAKGNFIKKSLATPVRK